ncbi:MAG: transglutaminase N-terminal domain-containing protein [Bryobacteraceae bacterium]
MRIRVEHSTVYRYKDAVVLEPHTFRLRPRVSATQRLVEFEMQIAPTPAGTTECLDQDGNAALHAWFNTPTGELSVRSRFSVELLRENPFDFVLDGSACKLSLWYPAPLCDALAPYRNDAQVGEGVKQYANVVAGTAQWDLLAFLTALNRQLFHSSRHVTRPDGPPWPSDLTLRLQEGSCRDLAVLFCDACRTVGIAARFVSGYECATAGRDDSYMHAWAEVYLPGAGWRGYDPSRGLAVANAHVAVAAGFDPELAAPISGLYTGGMGSRMETFLRLDVEPDVG